MGKMSNGKDWFRLLADLHKAGINNAEVSRLLNVPRWKIHDWKMGAEPNYSDGDRLVTLHAKHCSFVAVERPHERTPAL